MLGTTTATPLEGIKGHFERAIPTESPQDYPFQKFFVVRVVLVTTAQGDKAFMGSGSYTWIKDHGVMLSFEEAQSLFPDLERSQYFSMGYFK